MNYSFNSSYSYQPRRSSAYSRLESPSKENHPFTKELLKGLNDKISKEAPSGTSIELNNQRLKIELQVFQEILQLIPGNETDGLSL